MSKLQGKVALVTGASKGIGAAIALELASRAQRLQSTIQAARPAQTKVVAEIKKAGGKAIAVQANVADPDTIGPLVETVAKQLGPISILVNNAGIYEFGPLEAVTPEHFHKQFNVNVLGLLLTTQAALKHFDPKGGSIINIGSVAAAGIPTASVYSATKGAVDSITVALAGELGPRKIRVNSLNPGMVETEGVHAAGFIGSDFQKKIRAETPLGRIGQPEDIATSRRSLPPTTPYWVTGQIIKASGGAACTNESRATGPRRRNRKLSNSMLAGSGVEQGITRSGDFT